MMMNYGNLLFSQWKIILFVRCQMHSKVDHLQFDSQFEGGNLRKAIQVMTQSKPSFPHSLS